METSTEYNVMRREANIQFHISYQIHNNSLRFEKIKFILSPAFPVSGVTLLYLKVPKLRPLVLLIRTKNRGI
jgi:hypothetical protein